MTLKSDSMPRRKKERGDLLTLQFLESPLDRTPSFLSPDFGAINPITARRVDVNNIQESSWVTPQFGDKAYNSNRYGNQTSRRTTRFLKKSFDGKNCDAKVSNTKYKPLSFVTSTSCDSEKPNRYPIQNKGEIFTSRNLNVIGALHRTDGNNPCPVTSPVDSFPDSFRISTPVIDENSFAQENLMSTSSSTDVLLSHSKEEDDDDAFGVNTRLRGENISDGNQGNDNDDDIPHDSSIVFGKVKRPCLLDCSPSPSPPTPQVLVADTPECDYDLTLRQRQIKYLLRLRDKRR